MFQWIIILIFMNCDIFIISKMLFKVVSRFYYLISVHELLTWIIYIIILMGYLKNYDNIGSPPGHTWWNITGYSMKCSTFGYKCNLMYGSTYIVLHKAMDGTVIGHEISLHISHPYNDMLIYLWIYTQYSIRKLWYHHFSL